MERRFQNHLNNIALDSARINSLPSPCQLIVQIVNHSEPFYPKGWGAG